MAEAIKKEGLTVEIGHYIAPEIKASSPKHGPPILARQPTTMLPAYQDCDTKSEEGLFSVAWAPDNKTITVSTGDGRIIVVKPDGSVDKILHSANSDHGLPITALKWRPTSKLLKTQQVLVSGSTRGDIEYWHVPSGKRMSVMNEPDNEIYTIDYRPDGQKLATAGKDMCVRIYDEATKKLETKFEQGVLQCRGHSNRIFASKFHPTDTNLIFTASWDRTVMAWDRRSGQCVKSIFGPYVCGEALCITNNNQIITGSWRKEDTIEQWDFSTGLRIKSVSWKTSPMAYTLKPHPKHDGVFAIAGTGYNVLRIFDINNDFRTECVHLADQKGIYSLDFDLEGDFIAYCGDSPYVSMKRVNLPSQYTEELQEKASADPYEFAV